MSNMLNRYHCLLLPLILTAEVVDLVVAKVFCVEKLSNVSYGVPIEGLTPTGREGHGDHSLRDVRQVQVKPLPLVATLVLRHLDKSRAS